jgi:hypothetical protein
MSRSAVSRICTALLLATVLTTLSPRSLAAATVTTLTATNAVDGTIVVPDTHGTPVTVIGNGTAPVKVWFPSYWAHKLTSNKSGTSVLEDQHASGQIITMTNVPAVYFENGAGFSLPSLEPINAAGAPVAAAPAIGPKNEIIRAPAPPLPSHPGEIVGLLLRNETKGEIPPRVVTFGQAFVQGDVKNGTSLKAMAGNDALPIQVDVKTRYPDRSVRHAIVSLQAPALQPSATLAVMLSSNEGTPSPAPITPPTILARGYDLTLVRDFGPASSLPSLSVSAARLLASSASNGTIVPWLSGPLASEYRVTQRIVPNMSVTFDIRATADGVIMTDVIMANDFAYLVAQTDAYSATVTQTGMEPWKSPFLIHHKFQQWHKVFWNKTTPMPSVIFDVRYLARSGALPNYDLSSGLSHLAVEQYMGNLGKADTGPLGAGLITKYMGTTGGRDDIGPTTSWATDYLVSQDPDVRTVMLIQADEAASIPWHTHEIDGKLVTAETHPTLWFDGRCRSADCMPGGGDSDVGKETGWGAENAHEPDLAYVPYLTTGSHFYLDQLEDEANWLILAQDPGYRQNEKGLIYPVSQVRGTAWNLRDIGNAAWIAPDDDANKAYFDRVLRNNLNGLEKLYLTDRAMLRYGAIEGFTGVDQTHFAPWQQDFLALTMSQLAFRGYDTAGRFASWMQNFVAGRFNHKADGFDPLRGPAYNLDFVDTKTNLPVATWGGLYQLNFGDKPPATQLEGVPTSGRDYAANARASNATLFSLTQNPQALRAFAFLAANTQPMLVNFTGGNSFNINPRLPDGHVLQNDEIQYSTEGGRLVAKAAHSLLIDNSALATSLRGADGVSIFMGGAGPATMIGASGYNYFFTGSGDTTVDGATGKNFFILTGAKIQIDLSAVESATDRIEGFKPDRHRIHVIGLGSELAKVIGAAQKTADGVLIQVGPTHTVEFVGLTPNDLSAAFFN